MLKFNKTNINCANDQQNITEDKSPMKNGYENTCVMLLLFWLQLFNKVKLYYLLFLSYIHLALSAVRSSLLTRPFFSQTLSNIMLHTNWRCTVQINRLNVFFLLPLCLQCPASRLRPSGPFLWRRTRQWSHGPSPPGWRCMACWRATVSCSGPSFLMEVCWVCLLPFLWHHD